MRSKILIILAIIIFLYGCATEVKQPEPIQQPSVQETAQEQVRADEVDYMSLTISSTAFKNHGDMPSKYSCDGEDINPPLRISGVPLGAKSLVLIVDDPDAPVGVWNHWIVWNIPPETTSIKEDSVPGIQGLNSWGRNDWGGPCPPSGTHSYMFKLYALDTELDIDAESDKVDVESAMEEHILEEAELVGKYSTIKL